MTLCLIIGYVQQLDDPLLRALAALLLAVLVTRVLDIRRQRPPQLLPFAVPQHPHLEVLPDRFYPRAQHLALLRRTRVRTRVCGRRWREARPDRDAIELGAGGHDHTRDERRRRLDRVPRRVDRRGIRKRRIERFPNGGEHLSEMLLAPP